ncbi:acylneuraminate cytidylyltransferase [Bdellovibrio sp. 22V]|uniref:acylneuraminate cytidylyltransferase n=1 Tax=Bdellovibrio TaxID=958 RepID=UPI002543B1A9|nr:acylneuraminate cytidylyltransferase [Bdellovibrio sp. 22V]WII71187.1 acylneuraminate cytidylyltransferase [Bdellovibrio sp. 22V]
MKAIVIAALLALSFTTGFTCSKNQPAEQAPTTEATPATTEAAPAEGTPAATTEAAPATTEAAPAAPAGETK